MTAPVLPGQKGSIVFNGRTSPMSVRIVDVPVQSRVQIGTELTRQTTPDGESTIFETPTLDASGLYLLECHYLGRARERSQIEVATRLTKTLGTAFVEQSNALRDELQKSGNMAEYGTRFQELIDKTGGTITLTLWISGGVVVEAKDEGGVCPRLGPFTGKNSSIFAASSGVQAALRGLIGRTPSELTSSNLNGVTTAAVSALQTLDNAWSSAPQRPEGPTTSPAVIALVKDGWGVG